jgi:hypothetical protein
MTVRRRNLASQNTLISFYGAALIVSAGVSVWEYRRESMNTLRIVATCGQLAFLMRTAPLPAYCKPLQSKYVVWGTVGLILRYFRPRLCDFSWLQIYVLHLVTMLAVICLFYHECNKVTTIRPFSPNVEGFGRSNSFGVTASSTAQ